RQKVEANSMLLFVHGYTVSFVDAAVRTAQLKYDLDMPHAAFYCWPSRTRFRGYPADEASARSAKEYLGPFLQKLRHITEANKVNLHVIAHSMGNIAFLEALNYLLLPTGGGEPNFKVAEVVFAAADVDTDEVRTGAKTTA